jgi:hypothetical protein
MMVACLSAVVVLPWFLRNEVLASPSAVLISALVGTAVALAYGRIRVARQFLTALAAAALAIPAMFLLNPDVGETFLPSESAAAVQTIEKTPPIVFVVFDELPLNSLLNSGGDIDAERYPNFADVIRRRAMPCRHCGITRSISLPCWRDTTTSLRLLDSGSSVRPGRVETTLRSLATRFGRCCPT